MNIVDKLNMQQASMPKVLLFQEGIFFKAYNEGAYLFTRYVKQYKVKQQVQSKTKSSYYAIGFPAILLPQLANTINNGIICTSADVGSIKELVSNRFVFDDKEYVLWQNSVNLIKHAAIPTIVNGGRHDASIAANSAIALLAEVKSFALFDKTPLQVMEWVMGLQKRY